MGEAMNSFPTPQKTKTNKLTNRKKITRIPGPSTSELNGGTHL
jgi:hypothetical protein